MGEGVSEMRIHFGPGYRVYFTQRGLEVVIPLPGGDKSTQAKDIKTALKLARELWEKAMALKLRKWDTAEDLKTEEEMALNLEACPEEAGDDAGFIAKAPGDIARAKGMTQVAKDTGLGRESLYKALSGEGNPSFATILKVAHALGLQLHAAPRHAPE
jgi:probable addiction module antidote protein